MKKIYYFASSVHPVHQGFIANSPEGYSLSSNIAFKDTETIRQYEKSYRRRLVLVSKVSNIVNPPRLWYSRAKCDLFHTNSGVLLTNRKPWVVSAEYGNSFFLNPLNDLPNNSLFKKYAARLLRGKYCKKILPYCEATKKSFLEVFQDYRQELETKTEVVYPPINPQK